MEDKQEPTQVAHPGAESTPASGGDEAVAKADVDALTLSDINALTGREYKDLDTAKKSIKEWQAEASRAQQPQTEKQPDESRAEYENRIAKLELDNFFARNQEHEANRGLIEKIAKADGISIQEALESDVYKSVYDAQQNAQVSQSKRTTVESNNRIAQGGSTEPDPSEFYNDPQKAASYVRQKFFNS